MTKSLLQVIRESPLSIALSPHEGQECPFITLAKSVDDAIKNRGGSDDDDLLGIATVHLKRPPQAYYTPVIMCLAIEIATDDKYGTEVQAAFTVAWKLYTELNLRVCEDVSKIDKKEAEMIAEHHSSNMSAALKLLAGLQLSKIIHPTPKGLKLLHLVGSAAHDFIEKMIKYCSDKTTFSAGKNDSAEKTVEDLENWLNSNENQ